MYEIVCMKLIQMYHHETYIESNRNVVRQIKFPIQPMDTNRQAKPSRIFP